ncbi:MAG TPA: DHH family phosphoesterase [Tepidisphaeraceae bacterium]|nr:DHH family phosphoesterase [Tepidisphaeraceae bacterium]
MSRSSQADSKIVQAEKGLADNLRGKQGAMTAFVESCVEAAEGSAVAVVRGARYRPHAHKLIRVLKDKKNILVTTHRFPDPDALASCLALSKLLRAKLKGAQVTISIKGKIGGGFNSAFADQTDLELTPWDDEKLAGYDAIVLLDVQPMFEFSPLPVDLPPIAVIDHHRARGRKPACPFCDVRTDVGATSSILFSYFMELEVDIPPELAAAMLFAIETDLAGAAGTPGELDNMALSSLTLMADTRKLYKMRYAKLPQSVYVAVGDGLDNAVCYDSAVLSHLPRIESPEMPAIVADLLLRFEPVQWALVTAVTETGLQLSLRTSSKTSAADIMRRLMRKLGHGGGHRTTAGGEHSDEDGLAGRGGAVVRPAAAAVAAGAEDPLAKGAAAGAAGDVDRGGRKPGPVGWR